ncbi:MAG: N-acetyltransferase [Candidatus Altiarchaeota archaeon]
MIRNLERQDIEHVCELHLSEFKNSFFCMLGKDFLRELYWGIMDSGDAVSIICEEDGEIIGFASAALKPERFFRKLASSSFLNFSVHVILKAIKNPKIIFHGIQTLYYPSRVRTPADSELLAVAVSEKHRNKGIGSKLVSKLIEELKNREACDVKVVVDEANIEGNLLYESNGFTKKKTITMYGKKMNVYARTL